jgi:hypothetical protein
MKLLMYIPLAAGGFLLFYILCRIGAMAVAKSWFAEKDKYR